VPAILTVCPTDPRLAQWAMMFEERASALGRWWGTTRLVRFCLTDGCLVLPREVAVVEKATINGMPLRTENEWFQFVRPHVSCDPKSNCFTGSCSVCNCCGCGDVVLEDHLTDCSFTKTIGTNKKIRTYIGGLSDVGKKVIYQGYDKNGVWIRTNFGGFVQDGEQVTLASPFVDTTTIWAAGSPTGVIKDVTDWRLLVYELDTGTILEGKQLAIYQPDETIPTYRVMNITNFNRVGGCSSTSTTRTLLAIVSVNPMPIKNDNDWLLFQNLATYQDGMQAIKYWEEGNAAMGNSFFYGDAAPARNREGNPRMDFRHGAIPMLQAERRKMTGDRTTVNLQHDGVSTAGFL